MALPPMVTVTYLPLFVTILFRGMPGMWKSRHRFVLCWLVVMQALFPGRKTLEELARWTPVSLTVWRFCRVLKAASIMASATFGHSASPDNVTCWHIMVLQ
jgi:hypothetical protein